MENINYYTTETPPIWNVRFLLRLTWCEWRLSILLCSYAKFFFTATGPTGLKSTGSARSICDTACSAART